MNKAKVAAISLIVFSILLAAGIAVGGYYLYKYLKPMMPESNSKISVQKYENGMFNSYMYNVQNKIKSNWTPPKGDSSRSVVLLFKIDRSGKILSYKVEKSSGDRVMDDAAIDALVKSQPFDTFPEGFSGDDIEINFTFDYNVHKKN